MKNYGLQLKEIPIIFRSMLDQKTSETITSYYWPIDQTIKGISGYGMYGAQILYSALGTDKEADIKAYLATEPDNIRFKFGNDYYDLPAVQSGATYGEMSGQRPVFTNYPLFVSFNPDNIQILLNDGNEHIFSMRCVMEETIYTGGKAIYAADLTGNGQINHFRARFACGENGTLHLRPYVILNGNIRVNLCNFAQGGDQYIAGDNEEIEFDCYVPIETHAVAYVEAENTGEYPSLVDAAMTVQYEDFIESESIVGYEGVNLRRGRR